MSINTVNQAILYATNKLEGVADTQVRYEAEILLAFILKTTKVALLMNPHKKVTKSQGEAYRKLVKKRAAGWPIAYLTGTKGFYDLDLIVTPDVLIPRPETELIVELVLKHMSGQRIAVSGQILDIGTGPGTIALTLARQLPQASIVGSDISTKALAVAKKNKAALKVKNVQFVISDLLESIKEQPDVLTANLPYLTAKELSEPSIAREPRLALYGGRGGTELYRRLFKEIVERGWTQQKSKKNMTLYLEIGSSQAAAITKLAQTIFGHPAITVHQDYAGLDRALEIVL